MFRIKFVDDFMIQVFTKVYTPVLQKSVDSLRQNQESTWGVHVLRSPNLLFI